MQIHELNTGAPADSDVLAMDTGSDTYKTTPGNVVPDYTSGDSSTATSWTSVTAVASGLSFSTLIGRITTMMKNVRFLYGLLGTTDISGIGGGTVTGAISTLNSNLKTASKTVTGTTSVYGTINLDLANESYEVVMVKSSSNLHRVIPISVGSATYGIVLNDAATWSPVTNTSVTLTIKYRPIV